MKDLTPLNDVLQHWDQKHTETLIKLYNDLRCYPTLIDHTLTAMTAPEQACAATWIIKYALDNKAKLSDKQVDMFTQNLSLLTEWQSRLHGLQILSLINLTKKHAKRLSRFIYSCIDDKNKFVRAWAYSGLYLLAQLDPDYEKDVVTRIEHAIKTEAPSIKARLRKVLEGK